MKTSGTHAFVNQLMVGFLLTAGLGGSIGLATVWMRYQISVAADANRALQQQFDDVQREVADHNVEIEQALNSDVLLAENRSMRLGLEELKQTQIVGVPDDPVYRLVARANRRVFESRREGGAGSLHVTFQLDPPSATANGSSPEVASAASRPGPAPFAPLHLNRDFGAGTAAGALNLTFASNPQG